jgi:hypothetical protein
MSQEDTKPIVQNQNRSYGWILIAASTVLTLLTLGMFGNDSPLLVATMIPGALGVLALVLR